MWQVLNIAAASLIGVSVAAVFGRNMIILLMTPLALGMFEGGLIFAARALAPDEGASGSAWIQLSNPLLLPAVLIASGVGIAIAAFLLSRGEGEASPIWIPGSDDTKRGPNWRARNWVGQSPPVQDAPPSAPRPPLPRPMRQAAPQPVLNVVAPPAVRPPPLPAPAIVPEVNKRTYARRRAVLSGLLAAQDGSTSPCTIRDLSVRGAQVRLAGATPLPHHLWLIDQSNGIAHWSTVAWRDGMAVGLQFARSLDLQSGDDPALEMLRRLWRSGQRGG